MSKTYQYETSGTCSKAIDITIGDDGRVENVEFTGGCNGNTKGLAAMCRGRQADDVAGCLRGITCGSKPTSCPDQLARALDEVTHTAQGS